MANLFFLEIFSLNIKNPPIFIRRMLPALYRGKATEVCKLSKDKIKKYEENKLGIPTANPVRISFRLNFVLSFKVKKILIRKATKNIKKRKISLYSFNPYC